MRTVKQWRINLRFLKIAWLALLLVPIPGHAALNCACTHSGIDQNSEKDKGKTQLAATQSQERPVSAQKESSDKTAEKEQTQSHVVVDRLPGKDRWDITSLWLTAGLLLVGTITFGVVWYQAKETARSAKATEKSVKALITSERPWLLLRWAKNDPEINNPVLRPDQFPKVKQKTKCLFEFENYGKSPARVMSIKFELRISENVKAVPYDIMYNSEGSEQIIEGYVIPPGKSLGLEAILKPNEYITDAEWDAVTVQKSSFVWLCGYLKYRDTFDEDGPMYESSVCFIWDTRSRHAKPFWHMGRQFKYNRAT